MSDNRCNISKVVRPNHAENCGCYPCEKHWDRCPICFKALMEYGLYEGP